MPVIHNFQGLNGYRARERESRERVVGPSIVMPTTKQWGKVEVDLGFGNFFNFILRLMSSSVATKHYQKSNLLKC